MSIEAHHLLTFANALRSGDKPEVELRCAASRAYYGALHSVDETFKEFGPPVNGRTETSHDRIIGKPLHHARQSRPGSRDATSIAQLLPQIKRLRNEADYDLSCEYPKLKVDEVLKRASEIARLCISVKTQLGNSAQQANSLQPTTPLLITTKASDALDGEDPPPSSPTNKPSLKRIR